MRLSSVTFLWFLQISSLPWMISSTKEVEKRLNLHPHSSMRVGVKKRVRWCKERSKHGDKLSVHYVGTLYRNDKEFDSSRERKIPFEFVLGKGQVMKGWDKGLFGMCEGEIRKLVIPSELAYGQAGATHEIEPGDTLVFEIELLEVKTYDPENDLYETITARDF